MPFSAGARSCLGRRFFETEGVAILTVVVSRYRVELKEEAEAEFKEEGETLGAGETLEQRRETFGQKRETFEQKRERILTAKQGLTLV